MIRTNYYPEADVLHIVLGADSTRSDTSEEVAPGVYLEFDSNGTLVGVEITSASKRDAQRLTTREKYLLLRSKSGAQ